MSIYSLRILKVNWSAQAGFLPASLATPEVNFYPPTITLMKGSCDENNLLVTVKIVIYYHLSEGFGVMGEDSRFRLYNKVAGYHLDFCEKLVFDFYFFLFRNNSQSIFAQPINRVLMIRFLQ